MYMSDKSIIYTYKKGDMPYISQIPNQIRVI